MTPTRPSHLQARCELRSAADALLEVDNATPAMRFGTAVHAVLEGYYLGQADPPRWAAEALPQDNPCVKSLRGAGWRSPAGRCAMSGLPHLPRPDKCVRVVSEGPAVVAGAQGEPPIAGTRDLYVELEADEQARLGVATPELVIDFKTSSNPELYAKHVTQLRRDSQGIVYPLAAMIDFGLERVACRWLYLPSRAPWIGAVPVDFIQRRARLERIGIPALREKARRRLEVIQRPELATLNADACRDYAKVCPHHVDAGGFCNGKEADMGKMAAKIAEKRAQQAAEQTVTIDPVAALAAVEVEAESKAAAKSRKAEKDAPAAEPATAGGMRVSDVFDKLSKAAKAAGATINLNVTFNP